MEINYSELEYIELMSIIISGCKFKYFSYDHKKAIEEYKLDDKFIDMRKHIPNPQSYDMPDELKEKYKVERIGKLRQINFSPDGKAYSFKIGAKYSKTYGLDDFGMNVFPMIEDSNKNK
jgi:hypothetical protein